jgi:hypothetical protein
MDRLHAAASEQSPTAATFLEGGKIISVAPGNITVEYPKNLAASARMLDRNGKRESLQQVLSDLLGEPTGIKLEVSDVEVIEEKPPTPERRVHRPAPASSPQAESAPVNQGLPLTDELRTEILQNNPLIKSIAEAFNARVVKVE